MDKGKRHGGRAAVAPPGTGLLGYGPGAAEAMDAVDLRDQPVRKRRPGKALRAARRAAVQRIRAIRQARAEVQAELAPVRRAYYAGDRSPGTVTRMEVLSRRFNTLGQALASALRDKRRLHDGDMSPDAWRSHVRRKWGAPNERLARSRRKAGAV